jgi:glycosyltransferase involved in cell wall biosynthesis/GT2 family glycosyltransferase
VKVVFEQSHALAAEGFDVVIVTLDDGPSWFDLRVPLRTVPDFEAQHLPAADVYVGTFFTTVPPAAAAGRGIAAHLVQGYEGDQTHEDRVRRYIEAVYALPTAKLAISPQLAEIVEERFHQRCRIVRNGIDTTLFHAGERALATTPRIVVPGHFDVECKGVPVALQALRILRDQGRQFEVVRISASPQSGAERAILAADAYHHRLEAREVAEVLRSSEIVVSASTAAEGFGLPALEGMACGCASVLSDIPSYRGFAEAVGGWTDYAAFVERERGPDAFATAITALLDDPARRAMLGAAGAELAAHYGWDAVGPELAETFRSLLGEALSRRPSIGARAAFTTPYTNRTAVAPAARTSDATASILVDASTRPAVLDAQLTALSRAAAGADIEVVLVEPHDGPAIPVPDSLRVVRHRAPGPVGRRAALIAAAARASREVCIALGPLARPEPGFLAPLIEAVRTGAALASPVLLTPVGRVYGYAVGTDGALLPIAGPGREPDALALDCLAAARGFWVDHLPEPNVLLGPYELQLAAAARRVGPVITVAGSVVGRETIGEPLSVIVCTSNRAEELVGCVDALVAHGTLAAECEIVIVDSASTDDTPGVAAELARRHGPGVTVVREDVPGLSRARMAGVRHARHEVLSFVDDDARPGPGWLEHLRDAFVEPDVAIVGGPIAAIWPEGADWRPFISCAVYYSVLTRGDRDFADETVSFYGANWAIRRAVLEAVGGFEDRWGAGRQGALPGEESAIEFAVRRQQLGRLFYAAGAAVSHRIARERLDDGWLLARIYREGLVVPHVLANFSDPDPRTLLPAAQAAARAVLSEIAPTCSHLTADEALSLIAARPISLAERGVAARQLGVLVRSLWLAGAESAYFDGVRVHVTTDAAVGRVARPSCAAPAPLASPMPPAAPELRSFAVLAFADELIANPGLLAQYGSVFGPSDDATLVILLGDTPVSELVTAVTDAGLAGDDGPDVLALEAGVEPPRTLHAVYSKRGTATFNRLPRLGQPADLKALARERALI